MRIQEPPTRFEATLGHHVRNGPWTDQGTATYTLVLEALAEDRHDDASSLARLTIQEAQEAYDLYLLWLGELPELLAARLAESDVNRLRNDSVTVSGGLQHGWVRFRDLIGRFEQLVRDGRDARGVLEQARATWCAAHDSATDQLAAMLALAARELGEACIGPLWDSLLGHYYEGIRDKYDPEHHSWGESLQRLGLDIFEAVRGHLTGPARDGEFKLREEEDRWVLEFAPCGSGGRTYPGSTASERDPAEFTTEEHDWAWRTKGVCLYCVHCCQLQQRAPIQQLGFPLRVIQPPVRAAVEAEGRSVCTWSIYKDPSRVPAHAYFDVGLAPPTDAASPEDSF